MENLRSAQNEDEALWRDRILNYVFEFTINVQSAYYESVSHFWVKYRITYRLNKLVYRESTRGD